MYKRNGGHLLKPPHWLMARSLSSWKAMWTSPLGAWVSLWHGSWSFSVDEGGRTIRNPQYLLWPNFRSYTLSFLQFPIGYTGQLYPTRQESKWGRVSQEHDWEPSWVLATTGIQEVITNSARAFWGGLHKEMIYRWAFGVSRYWEKWEGSVKCYLVYPWLQDRK